MARLLRPVERGAPVDIALSRIRGLAAILAAALVVLAPGALVGSTPVPSRALGIGVVGVLLGVNVLSSLRRRRHWGHVALFVLCEVLIDLALSVGVMLLQEPTEAPSLILALPLIEAGIRFGTLGTLSSWSLMLVTASGRVAMTVPVDQVGDATRTMLSGLVALVLVALPISYLAEHLVTAVHHTEEVNRRSQERASTLEVLSSAALRLTTLDHQEIVDRVASYATTLGCEGAAVWELTVDGPVRCSGADDAATAPTGSDDDELDGYRRLFAVGDQRYALTYRDPIGGAPELRDEAVDVLVLQARAALNSAALFGRVAALEREHEEASRTDALTGLPNRRALERMDADGYLRHRSDWAVVYVDLDGFKAVNDQLGHDRGDDVLRDVAAHLRTVAAGHTVFRLGGDEFVVLIRGLDARDDVRDLAEEIEAFSWFEHRGPGAAKVVVGASAGVAFPDPDESLGEVVARADRAMYTSKRERSDRRRGERRAGPTEPPPVVIP